MNKQTYKFCMLILNQGNLHGWKRQPVCEGNLIAHIDVEASPYTTCVFYIESQKNPIRTQKNDMKKTSTFSISSL